MQDVEIGTIEVCARRQRGSMVATSIFKALPASLPLWNLWTPELIDDGSGGKEENEWQCSWISWFLATADVYLVLLCFYIQVQ